MEYVEMIKYGNPHTYAAGMLNAQDIQELKFNGFKVLKGTRPQKSKPKQVNKNGIGVM